MENVNYLGRGLFKATSIFAIFTLLSRITGLIRELVFAYFFGATAVLDVFLIAYRIPNFLRRLFAEGALTQAFIPVLTEHRSVHKEFETQHLLNQLFTCLSSGTSLIVILAICGAPFIISLFAPGLPISERYLAIQMLRFTFPFLLFITFSAFYGGILNSYGYFGISAFAPVGFNLVLVAVTLFVGMKHKSVSYLAVGVTLAGLAQWLLQIPKVAVLGKIPKWSWSTPGKEVKRVFYLMLPSIFGLSVNQFIFLINTILASYLKTGSLAWLNYGERLASLPLGIIGVAIATVVLPRLSQHVVAREQEAYTDTVNWSLKIVWLLAIPAVLGLWFLGEPIIITLFMRGKFSVSDVIHTYRGVVAYALGIPFFMQVRILVTSFYAHQDMKTPVKVGIYAVGVNALGALLSFPLAHVGLALASSLAAIVNSLILLYLLWQKGWYSFPRYWYKPLLQIGVGQIVLGLFLWLVRGNFIFWLGCSEVKRILLLFMLVGGAMLLYGTTLSLMGFKWNKLLS